MTSVWTPGRWRDLPTEQQPDWPDTNALEQTLKTLSSLPPLVFAGEARSLRKALADVAAGEAFLLQAGDCAESFHDFTADAIRDKLKVILQMAVVLTYGAGVPVVKLGRIAGQFAKPRSSPTEVVNGVTLPSFRGHLVSDDAPTVEARTPDPERLLAAYHQAASTLNLLRAFTKGGYADLSQLHTWNQEFVASSLQGKRYAAIAGEIERALRFMKACGIDLINEETLHQVDFWTSHEALILGWEEAMTRCDSLSGLWYDTSAHLLWVGERTRQLGGAHLDFLSGIANPLGAKIGPLAHPDEVVALCDILDPDRQPGRLILVARMGAPRVAQVLPELLRAVRASGHPVIWQCDPMHGNTVVGPGGRKTRHFDAVLTEIKAFFEVCRASGIWPGGVHVELTGDDVTECLGGAEEILADQLSLRYTTTCDPRLNGRQSLDLAFQVAELLRH
ncbi:MAG: 3-deoxy-7-phosphoheptulonate synthase class II [Actinomycetota bacterium]|nr:3-deoxy-7-phosphoheptulonate synthase class II [Actinomycetota bacterium]